MSTKLRFYVGEILDIYKQAASSQYGSVDNATTASSLLYLTLKVYLSLQVQLVSKFTLMSLRQLHGENQSHTTVCIHLAFIHSKGSQGSSEEDEDQDPRWEDG
jgi:hypothetical protein